MATAVPQQRSKSQINIEAEQSLLGSIMLMHTCLDTVQRIVRVEDFVLPEHQMVYMIALDLHAKGKPVDAVIMDEELAKRGRSDLFPSGRAQFLSRIMETVAHAAHADYFANIVHEAAMVRRMAELGSNIATRAKDHGAADNVLELLTESEQAIHALMESLDTGGEPVKIGDLLIDTLASIGAAKRRGTPTGFPLLDRMTNGWQPGNLVILAGRPGAGKTALLCDLAVETARQNYSVLVFSMEQSKAELSERILAYEAGVSSSHLKDGTARDQDMLRERCMDAAARLNEMPILIDDTPGLTVAQIASKSRRIKRKRGIKLIIIDYLQIAEPPNRKDPREQQVAAMSRSLKNLARELEVPIICLAQINRQIGNRPNKRPILQDLRESGSLEQDANIVAFVHRPCLFDDDHPQDDAELIIAKNRDGQVGSVYLDYTPHLLRFTERVPQAPYVPPRRSQYED